MTLNENIFFWKSSPRFWWQRDTGPAERWDTEEWDSVQRETRSVQWQWWQWQHGSLLKFGRLPSKNLCCPSIFHCRGIKGIVCVNGVTKYSGHFSRVISMNQFPVPVPPVHYETWDQHIQNWIPFRRPLILIRKNQVFMLEGKNIQKNESENTSKKINIWTFH